MQILDMLEFSKTESKQYLNLVIWINRAKISRYMKQ